MSHAFYVNLSYVFAFLISAAMIGWIVIDGRARKREMAELEAAGIRRRSSTSTKDRSQ